MGSRPESERVTRWVLADLLRIVAATQVVGIATTAAVIGSADSTLGITALLLVGGLGLVGAILVATHLQRGFQTLAQGVAGVGALWPSASMMGSGVVATSVALLAPVLSQQSGGVGPLGIPAGVLLGAEMSNRVRAAEARGGRVAVTMVLAVGASAVGATAVALVAPVGPWSVVALVGLTSGVAVGVWRLSVRSAATLGARWEGFRAAEGRRRAEWIHDSVLSEVSHAIHLLRARPTVDHEAVAHLRAMDHRLRIAQLEEVMAAGSTRVASILQPHLRRAEELGLRIVRLPLASQIEARVDPATGRMLNHVVAVLVANAANAGAESLGLEVEVRADEIEVALHDDAGGFDLATVPPGRALDELRTDIGHDRIRCEPSAAGSVVRVRVPRELLLGSSATLRRSATRWVG